MIARRLAAAALSLACASAPAANISDDAPLAHFKGKDQALFDEALHAVLDKGEKGMRRSWSNPETKAGGEVRAVKSFTRGDAPCRTVHISNKAAGRTSAQNYDFCRSAAGKWVLTK